GLPVGGRSVREGGVGAGAGGPARGRGGPRGRPEGGGGGCAGLPGVGGELVGGAAGPAGPRDERAQAGDRGWAPRDLGRAAQRLAGGGGAALLEPQGAQRAGAAAAPAAGRGQAHAPGDRVRPDPGGGGTEAQGVRGLVSPARLREGGGDAGAGLGAHGDVLRLPQRALAPPADHQRGGIALRRAAAAYGRGQAVQKGGAGHGGDLEDADGGPVTVSEIECSGVAGQGLRRGAVRRRHRGRGEGGRRLSTFTHLLTEARRLFRFVEFVHYLPHVFG